MRSGVATTKKARQELEDDYSSRVLEINALKQRIRYLLQALKDKRRGLDVNSTEEIVFAQEFVYARRKVIDFVDPEGGSTQIFRKDPVGTLVKAVNNGQMPLTHVRTQFVLAQIVFRLTDPRGRRWPNVLKRWFTMFISATGDVGRRTLDPFRISEAFGDEEGRDADEKQADGDQKDAEDAAGGLADDAQVLEGRQFWECLGFAIPSERMSRVWRNERVDKDGGMLGHRYGDVVEMVRVSGKEGSRHFVTAWDSTDLQESTFDFLDEVLAQAAGGEAGAGGGEAKGENALKKAETWLDDGGYENWGPDMDWVRLICTILKRDLEM